jgi:hypothetical protein
MSIFNYWEDDDDYLNNEIDRLEDRISDLEEAVSILESDKLEALIDISDLLNILLDSPSVGQDVKDAVRERFYSKQTNESPQP